MSSRIPLVCISHLRWDFVWQRPQHLLTRLAKHYDVYFVEEPMTAEKYKAPTLDVFPAQQAENVTIVRLHWPTTPDKHFWIGHGDARTQATYERLLTQFLAERGVKDPVLWLYTPMAAPFVDALPHRTLVFDAMDMLSAFAGAPPELIEQEKQLLPRADVVFTGGMSLFHAKRPLNPEHTYAFPSGVEGEHFAPAARRESFPVPPELAKLSAPIVGFFGVIDERLDLQLLAKVADLRPNWQIVLLGPVVKIDPATLPKRTNLHYPGGRDYKDLPRYLAHFDVAILPFALNEATRYISPTKTLEYMAAHKPIVSTPVRDVVESYGEVVRIAATPAEFVQQVETALTETPPSRRAAEDRLLAANAWDNIAEQMHRLIETAGEYSGVQTKNTSAPVTAIGRAQTQSAAQPTGAPSTSSAPVLPTR